jgi:malonyl-CoA/methylmalonyl-CoA synthetase
MNHPIRSDHRATPVRDDARSAAIRDGLRAGVLPIELLRGGSGVALQSSGETVTHEELRGKAGAVAGGLRELGIRAGDRIAIHGATSMEWVETYLGALRAGACVVPMNPDYKSAETAHIVSDSDPSLIAVDTGRSTLAERLGVPVLAFADIPRAAPPPMPALTSDTPALIIYTSGTTGRSKGAVLDHGGLLALARGVGTAWQWSSADHLVHSLPLCHVHGLCIGLHGTLLQGGSATLLPFSPAEIVDELSRRGRARSTIFFGVPAMYQRLCECLEGRAIDLSHVRLFVSGSAPLPPALFERCSRLLGQPPLERYGTTETGIIASNPYDGARRPGRVGFPLPGVDVKLGTADEVLVRGAQVFRGYWRQPAATGEAFTPDGFFRTGDVGEIGDDGTLAIRSRLKDVIISGGFNVYPREVEIVLESHHTVNEVAVAGVPSERWGEEVTAFVAPAEGQPVITDELIAYARERLAAYKCPRRIVIIDQLPRNAMGKVLKTALIERQAGCGS